MGASTLHRWLDGAGRRAQRQVAGQLEGVGCSGAAGTLALPAAGTDGLLDRLFVYRLPEQQGLLRVTPEWVWRDFRLRLSHGRNHGSEQRLERAALLWAIYHNFTPAQWRCERKRHYKHPGQIALQVAGASPGEISYLDALGV